VKSRGLSPGLRGGGGGRKSGHAALISPIPAALLEVAGWAGALEDGARGSRTAGTIEEDADLAPLVALARISGVTDPKRRADAAARSAAEQGPAWVAEVAAAAWSGRGAWGWGRGHYVSFRWCQVWMVLIQMTKPSRFSKFSPQAKLRRGMSCHEHVALNCLNNSPLPEPEHPSSAIGCAR
jgi:hypothetical protein